ncbi:hypothetical protein [Streptomyces sp. JHA26]|uniref:hypothetical protein n=1 Tax=Streptomyces sp. JHA26 TaxID=1917143 RepID=UPI0015C551E7|nr:hypothetical protein [Streptomyces sp. JHA26]
MSTVTGDTRGAAAEEPASGHPLVDEEWGEDPLEGVPAELVDRVGVLDHDTAGGCG